jgi:hypothetical protein
MKEVISAQYIGSSSYIWEVHHTTRSAMAKGMTSFCPILVHLIAGPAACHSEAGDKCKKQDNHTSHPALP